MHGRPLLSYVAYLDRSEALPYPSTLGTERQDCEVHEDGVSSGTARRPHFSPEVGSSEVMITGDVVNIWTGNVSPFGRKYVTAE